MCLNTTRGVRSAGARDLGHCSCLTNSGFDIHTAVLLANAAELAYEGDAAIVSTWTRRRDFDSVTPFNRGNVQGFGTTTANVALLAFRGTSNLGQSMLVCCPSAIPGAASTEGFTVACSRLTWTCVALNKPPRRPNMCGLQDTASAEQTARSRWSSGDVNAAEGQLIVYHELVRLFAGKPIKLQFADITETKQPEVEIRPVSGHRMSWIRSSCLWLMERSGCPNHPPASHWPDRFIRSPPVSGYPRRGRESFSCRTMSMKPAHISALRHEKDSRPPRDSGFSDSLLHLCYSWRRVTSVGCPNVSHRDGSILKVCSTAAARAARSADDGLTNFGTRRRLGGTMRRPHNSHADSP